MKNAFSPLKRVFAIWFILHIFVSSVKRIWPNGAYLPRKLASNKKFKKTNQSLEKSWPVSILFVWAKFTEPERGQWTVNSAPGNSSYYVCNCNWHRYTWDTIGRGCTLFIVPPPYYSVFSNYRRRLLAEIYEKMTATLIGKLGSEEKKVFMV